ncbi:hypothetical protein P9112_013204 [Eukaryota sp. TZLM1-RC]
MSLLLGRWRSGNRKLFGEELWKGVIGRSFAWREVLDCNTRVQVNITSEGASALARALESNSTLTELNLVCINITDEGASALARALESNSSLTTLYLGDSNITSEGASALARALESNSTLTRLYLQRNNISNPTKSKLRQIASNRPSLRIFV